jgi:hypothetical protein
VTYVAGLVALLVTLAGVIAYAGDRLGTWVGRRRLTLFGARPRRTGQIVGVSAGILIMLTTLGVLSLAFRSAAQTLLNAQRTAQQLQTLQEQERTLQIQLQGMLAQQSALEADLRIARGIITEAEAARDAALIGSRSPACGGRRHAAAAGGDRRAAGGGAIRPRRRGRSTCSRRRSNGSPHSPRRPRRGRASPPSRSEVAAAEAALLAADVRLLELDVQLSEADAARLAAPSDRRFGDGCSRGPRIRLLAPRSAPRCARRPRRAVDRAAEAARLAAACCCGGGSPAGRRGCSEWPSRSVLLRRRLAERAAPAAQEVASAACCCEAARDRAGRPLRWPTHRGAPPKLAARGRERPRGARGGGGGVGCGRGRSGGGRVAAGPRGGGP